MTVENTSNKKRFLGDGVTTEITFTFRVLSASDIRLYVYPEALAFDDLEDYLVSTNDYTVELEADGEGGTITLDTAAASDEIGLIINSLDLTQTADLPTEGNFNEQAVETALDRLVMQNIQQQEEITRAVQIRREDPLADDDFAGIFIEAVEAADRASRIMQFNSTGDGIEAGILTTDLDTLATLTDEIATLAAISGNITTVAGISANVTTVAGISASVTTVAGISASVSTVAGISANVTSVAGNAANINTVAGISANVTTVAGISANVTTVAGISADVTTVAGLSAQITALAAIASDITDAANNIPKANRTAVVAPTVNDDSGDGYSEGSLWIDTATNNGYLCLDPAAGAAVWLQITTAGTTLAGLTDVNLTGLANLDFIRYNSATSKWINRTPANVRTDLGLVIGTDVQAYDAELAALAGLVSAANTVPVFTGAGTAALVTLSASQLVGRGASGNVTNVTLGPGLAFTGSVLDVTATAPSASTKSDQETATSTTTYVSPGRQQYHPSAAKCWLLSTNAPAITVSYNITSVTNNGAGSHTYTIATDFSSANWVPIVTANDGSTGSQKTMEITARAAGSVTVQGVQDPGGSGAFTTNGSSANFVGFGDQ